MTELFIQKEGSTAWSKVWPDAQELPPGLLSEGASYIFELRNFTKAGEADLFIDNIKLEALRPVSSDTARWRWRVGFYAGTVSASLQLHGLGQKKFEILADPDLRKLTRSDFDCMVKDLLEDTHALFALSAFRKGISKHAGATPPPIARLEYLVSRTTEIIEAVRSIERAPRNFLQARTSRTPIGKAR